ncbi:MAG: methyltransferase [Proteobacteria bacterium]|nr:methyltransferase [Pseudomonadota bacterium]
MQPVANTDPLCQQILDGLAGLGERTALVSDGQIWTGDEILETTYRTMTGLRERALDTGGSLIWNAGDLRQAVPIRLAAMLLGARFTAGSGPENDGHALTITARDLAILDGRRANQPRLAKEAPFTVVRTSFVWSAAAFSASIVALRDALGSPPARTAVVSSLAEFGGDAALASWSAGIPVYHQQPAVAPGKVLAFLDRTDPDSAVVSATLLRDLVTHPALALADLDRLECVVYDAGVGGALSAHELAEVRHVLGVRVLGRIASQAGILSVEHAARRAEKQAVRIADVVTDHPAVATATAIEVDQGRWAIFAVPAPRGPDAVESGPGIRQLLAETTAAVDAEFGTIDLSQAIFAVQKLGRTALLSMLNGLYRCGLFTSSSAAHGADEVVAVARVASRHRSLIRRWLRVLTEQGLLHRDGDLLRAVPRTRDYSDTALAHAWDEVEAAWMAALGVTGTIDYARRNAEVLPELIRGQVQAVHLLFPEGRSDLARALYREHIAARYQHRAVAALVGRIARQWPGRRPLRVLEVGAGTGATSEALLPELSDLDVDYLYTDVSRYFLDQAAPELARYPAVHFGLYDIDVSPRDQGVAPNSVDVVIGGGVLNAARNTDASLGWLNELLAPGGWLVVTEPTVEEFWVMASQAFMLADASDGRVETEATFLSHAQWNAVLDRAGLRRILELPGPGHPLEPLGHRVFAARAKTDRMALTVQDIVDHLGEHADAVHIEIVDHLPLLADGALDREQLRVWAATCSSVELRSPTGPRAQRQPR